MDARTAISRPTRFMNRPDYRSQTLVALASGTRRSSLRRIEAGAANSQQPAHQRQREVVTVNADAGVLHSFSFAKYAAAFFRKSRSCSKRSTSRRKRFSSDSWPLPRPWPGKRFFFSLRGSPSTCRFHARNMSGRIPSLPATSAIDCWPSATNLTASSLNSRVNCRLLSPMNTSNPEQYHSGLSRCPRNQGKFIESTEDAQRPTQIRTQPAVNSNRKVDGVVLRSFVLNHLPVYR